MPQRNPNHLAGLPLRVQLVVWALHLVFTEARQWHFRLSVHGAVSFGFESGQVQGWLVWDNTGNTRIYEFFYVLLVA